MEIQKLSISGSWQTYSPLINDSRGVFKELFKQSTNVENTNLHLKVAQTNLSISKKGVIRGIHYSLNPLAQWKSISCISGSILDIVVDIRFDSPTFGSYEEVELNDTNGKSILIQGNLGHAFQALTDNAIVLYNLSSEYIPEFENEINPLDELININWPISEQIFSEKDFNAPSLLEKYKIAALPSIKI
jgi:dTDP-4-dehydrorhamnose 3,5-epimerase